MATKHVAHERLRVETLEQKVAMENASYFFDCNPDRDSAQHVRGSENEYLSVSRRSVGKHIDEDQKSACPESLEEPTKEKSTRLR